MIIIEIILLSGYFFAIIFCIIWMIQILKLTRQNRIINSMTLKVILKYCEDKGVNIDMQKIQKEVEENV
jgi:hypothetical protein